MMAYRTDAAYARERDVQDPLTVYRERFLIDDAGLVYMDGNSLGRLPKASMARAQDLLRREWGGRLIRGWNDGWMTLAHRIGGKLARLVGAAPDEVVVADSTSVNLFKLVMAALKHQTGRPKIVTDDLNFPSDLYILQSAAQLTGGRCRVEIVPSEDGIHGPVPALEAAIDETTALVALSHTAFKSGYVYDMAAVTALTHRRGAMMLWDLSHSVGALPVDLNGANADLAVGCAYKYVNGGPGAPAFLYVRRDLQDRLDNPVVGWFSHQDPFAFATDYRPADGIRRFLTGTPPVASLALIEPGVDILLEAGMGRLRAKSVDQSEYLIALWASELAPLGYTLNSPRAAAQRGSHVSVGHPEGYRIDQALIHEMGVIPDFRHPDHIRLGIAPAYTTYTEIHTAVTAMKTVVADRLYEKYASGMKGVT